MIVVEYCEPKAAARSREYALSVFLNGQPVVVSQGTPADLEDFGVGYLLSEGLISDRGSLCSILADKALASVWVRTYEAVPRGLPLRQRTSSASLVAPTCAGASLRGNRMTFDAEDLAAQMRAMEAASPVRGAGECVHCCAVGAAGSRDVLYAREDLGRHNAVDKAIGHGWLQGVGLQDKALLITGRISTEMAQKAIRAGVPALVSLKSATDEAIAMADQAGLALVSHCRNGSMRVVATPWRIRP